MVFSSALFLFYFLPLVLTLYYAWSHPRWRTGLLAVMSYCFYGWANPPWALIMFASTMVDYCCGIALIRLAKLQRDSNGRWPIIAADVPRTRPMKLVLCLSLVSNLALLAFFKYFDFGAETINTIAQSLGSTAVVPLLHIALPVGISFYTFQSMSYAIDVYRGEARPMTNFIDFHCFEALFPQLVAGPIVRYQDISEQLVHRTHTFEKFARGIAFLSCGLAKKILVANPMGYIADGAFNAHELATIDAWCGVVAYAFQIYFDFSGYSDMAVGLGLMFGFLFIKNFDSPYRATSITDFWRRWHISLSTWLRDYLYIPLGGNRHGPLRTYFNLMAVMLLGGLWHGASWNYVIWGGLHGGMLAFERAQGRDGIYRRLPDPLRIAITFAIVCIGWVFFRAPTLGGALSYCGALFGGGSDSLRAAVARGAMYTPYHLCMLAIAALLVWGAPQTWLFTRRLSPPRVAFCMTLFVLSLLFMWTQTANPFLYFQF
ncbi:MAG TPA: MBOAT family protein [Planctomycetota bacterium]|nr:MBOAT family protein [Planctomycetota bacterium]